MGLVFIGVGIMLIGIAMFIASRPRISSGRDTFSGPPDVISRDMKDPYAQAIWRAFDSGNVVTYSAGDDHLKESNIKEGTTTKVKLEG